MLRDSFDRTILITSSTVAALNFEQQFQRYSGLTDTDTIFELGRELKADYVIAGFFTRLGNQNLVVASIMDVESLQQVAGYYRAYNAIGETDAFLPEMAQKLASAALRDTSNLPGLSVPPFFISGVDQNDAQVLAQILACDLANSDKYAVLPRTDSIQYVMEEHRRQREGEYDQERVRRLGIGMNAQYVLAGSVQRLDEVNRVDKIGADILSIEDGGYIDGDEVRYNNISEVVGLIQTLAVSLSGGLIPENFVRIEGGTFTMGSPDSEPRRDGDEGPQHRVTVSGFYMGKYEVTQREYQAVMGTNPSFFKGDNLPVEYVSWYDAVEFCNALSMKEGMVPAYIIDKGRSDPNNTDSYDNKRWLVTRNPNANGYRLPTEAEWEYACRAGTTTPYNTGNNITTANANYDPYNNGDNLRYRGSGIPIMVGTFASNPWGLYDMHGNVREWCWDWYGNYSSNAQTEPVGASSGSGRVIRDGSWLYGAWGVRSAWRRAFRPSDRSEDIGFRLARNAD